jgi:hypothetical protein
MNRKALEHQRQNGCCRHDGYKGDDPVQKSTIQSPGREAEKREGDGYLDGGDTDVDDDCVNIDCFKKPPVHRLVREDCEEVFPQATRGFNLETC